MERRVFSKTGSTQLNNALIDRLGYAGTAELIDALDIYGRIPGNGIRILQKEGKRIILPILMNSESARANQKIQDARIENILIALKEKRELARRFTSENELDKLIDELTARTNIYGWIRISNNREIIAKAGKPGELTSRRVMEKAGKVLLAPPKKSRKGRETRKKSSKAEKPNKLNGGVWRNGVKKRLPKSLGGYVYRVKRETNIVEFETPKGIVVRRIPRPNEKGLAVLKTPDNTTVVLRNTKDQEGRAVVYLRRLMPKDI